MENNSSLTTTTVTSTLAVDNYVPYVKQDIPSAVFQVSSTMCFEIISGLQDRLELFGYGALRGADFPNVFLPEIESEIIRYLQDKIEVVNNDGVIQATMLGDVLTRYCKPMLMNNTVIDTENFEGFFPITGIGILPPGITTWNQHSIRIVAQGNTDSDRIRSSLNNDDPSPCPQQLFNSYEEALTNGDILTEVINNVRVTTHARARFSQYYGADHPSWATFVEQVTGGEISVITLDDSLGDGHNRSVVLTLNRPDEVSLLPDYVAAGVYDTSSKTIIITSIHPKHMRVLSGIRAPDGRHYCSWTGFATLRSPLDENRLLYTKSGILEQLMISSIYGSDVHDDLDGWTAVIYRMFYLIIVAYFGKFYQLAVQYNPDATPRQLEQLAGRSVMSVLNESVSPDKLRLEGLYLYPNTMNASARTVVSIAMMVSSWFFCSDNLAFTLPRNTFMNVYAFNAHSNCLHMAASPFLRASLAHLESKYAKVGSYLYSIGNNLDSIMDVLDKVPYKTFSLPEGFRLDDRYVDKNDGRTLRSHIKKMAMDILNEALVVYKTKGRSKVNVARDMFWVEGRLGQYSVLAVINNPDKDWSVDDRLRYSDLDIIVTSYYYVSGLKLAGGYISTKITNPTNPFVARTEKLIQVYRNRKTVHHDLLEG